MISKIIVDKNLKGADKVSDRFAYNIECKDAFDINLPEENIVLLFGGNGVGKTTLINLIKPPKKERINDTEESIKEEYTKRVIFKDNIPNEVHIFDYNSDSLRIRALEHDIGQFKDFGMFMQSTVSSYGESLIDQVTQFMVDLIELVRSNQPLTIVLDEIDCGMDLPNLTLLYNIMRGAIRINSNIQFIVSTNTYHMLHLHKRGFNMHTLEMTDINSYDDFTNIVESNMEIVSAKRKEIAQKKADDAKREQEEGFDKITETGKFRRIRH